jgi:hypothetical protein
MKLKFTSDRTTLSEGKLNLEISRGNYMQLKGKFLSSAAVFLIGLTANIAPAFAGQWYFYVWNRNGTSIAKLEVAPDGGQWKYFEIGSGIAPGERMKLIWYSSTDNESCYQWIRATFYDGSLSSPTKFNFCSDLDTPIEFY